ncbi:TPA: glucose PTS transporter subunit IIA [Streptococcus suis]
MRIRDYFADSMGQFSLNVIMGIAGQLTYFYTDKVGLAAGAVATVFMLNKIIDGFTDLFMGSIVDNTPAGKEKYRPWLLKAGIPAGLLLVAMFLVPAGPDWFRFAYVMVMNLVVTDILYSAIAIPYISLQVVRTNSQEERSNIGTWRAAAGYVSGMIMAIVVIPITNILGGDVAAWVKVVSFFGALIVCSMLICYRYAREKAVDSRQVATEKTAVNTEVEDKINYKEALSKLVKNKYWLILIVLNFATQVTWSINGAAGTYYAKWIYGNDNLVAMTGGLGLIASIIGFVTLAPLVKKFGPTKLLRAMALITTLLTAVRIFNPADFMFNTAIGLITTFTGIPMMALGGVLMAMVIDYNDFLFGTKMVGRSTSARSFTDKIGAGLGLAMIGWCLAIAGYDASQTQATEAVRQAIFTFSIYIPLILSIVSYVCLRKFDLEGRMVEIYAAIAERRTGGNSVELRPVSNATTASNEILFAPVAGRSFSLSEVNDPAFSNGAIGQGLAFKPTKGILYAPADGQVSLAFATGHALTINTEKGAEVFVHVGIDTVSMNGEGFELQVQQGDRVKAGDVIGTFDQAKIDAAGLSDTTVLLVTNTTDYREIKFVAPSTVKPSVRVIELQV